MAEATPVEESKASISSADLLWLASEVSTAAHTSGAGLAILMDDPGINEHLSWAHEGLKKAAELLKAREDKQ